MAGKQRVVAEEGRVQEFSVSRQGDAKAKRDRTRQGAERRVYEFSGSWQGAERDAARNLAEEQKDASRNLARCGVPGATRGVPGATRRRNEFLPRTSCPAGLSNRAYRTHPAFLTRRRGTREPSAGTARRLLVAASPLSLPGVTRRRDARPTSLSIP